MIEVRLNDGSVRLEVVIRKDGWIVGTWWMMMEGGVLGVVNVDASRKGCTGKVIKDLTTSLMNSQDENNRSRQ